MYVLLWKELVEVLKATRQKVAMVTSDQIKFFSDKFLKEC